MAKYHDNFLSATDFNGNNGIALAATEGHVDLLRWLHEKGCDINTPNRKDRNPIHGSLAMGPHLRCRLFAQKRGEGDLSGLQKKNCADPALPNKRNVNEHKKRMVIYHGQKAEADQ